MFLNKTKQNQKHLTTMDLRALQIIASRYKTQQHNYREKHRNRN